MRISDWSSDACSSDLLNYCRIEKSEAIHSELAVLGLDGSCLQAGLDAGGLRCGGGVYLRGGFHALDTVNLVGVTIGGDLDCDDATFEHPGGLALACSRAKVEGMFLLGTTNYVGEVTLKRHNGNAACGGRGCQKWHSL